MKGAIVTIAAAMFLLITTDSYAKSKGIYGASICNTEGYTCYTVKRGNTWEKLFPNSDERDVVMRINRLNTDLYRGMKIAIPTENRSDMMQHVPIPMQIDPPGKKTIIVTISKLAFGAYDSSGKLQYWGPVSTARGYCPDTGKHCNTALGKFTIYDKRGSDCVSKLFPIGRGGAPMPYCMFFKGNFALHGSYEVPGYNASHGCVRMFVKDAKWLNQEFTPGGSTAVWINKE